MGIFSLFTTGFWGITNEFTLSESVGGTDIHVCGILVKQVIFLTVNHCGPLPLRELHSTDDTIVWRDPGGSWACLRPVSHYEWIHPFRVCRWHRHTCMWHPYEAGRFSYGESPRTPPLEGNHSTDDTIDIVWRDPGGSWACLRPVSDFEWIQPSRGCMWHNIIICICHLYEVGHFSYSESKKKKKKKKKKKSSLKKSFFFHPYVFGKTTH